MLQPPLPVDEPRRLASLASLAILDTPPEERFDRLTRLAATFFGVPIVLVSLVDADRQWFKSRHGLGATETPRDVSFCGHAILQDAAFVVPDARQDPRFADNPLVVGEPNVIFYAGFPLRGPDCRKIGTLCLIDHQPRAFSPADEQALAEFAALAEEAIETRAATQAKSAFLAGMSHELRTPLNAILGYSELLIEQAEDEGQDALVPDLRKINGAGRHLLGLVDDILDLSKVEAGKMPVVAEDVDLAALFADIAAMARTLVERRANRFRVDVPAALPPAFTDGTKVRQIVLNLLSNAGKFTEGGEVALVVRAAADELVIGVEDTGIGMTEAQLLKLFRPFEQAEAATSRTYGGTGLGMALSRSLAHLIGGEIGVESAAGRGTAFTVRVPLRYEPGCAGASA